MVRNFEAMGHREREREREKRPLADQRILYFFSDMIYPHTHTQIRKRAVN